MVSAALLAISFVPGALAHGWITKPVSRLEMAYHHWSTGMPDDPLRWSPQSCNGPNSCGSTAQFYAESKEKWNSFYDIAGLAVPTYKPGSDIDVSIKITADHGGQSWMMISCADTISEDGPWTYMERALDDRGHHMLPSNPAIYAWPKDELVQKYNSILTAKWTMPANFSCPGGRGVGRWLWKTGNTCNDDTNLAAKKTETFKLSEFDTLNKAFSRNTQPSCSGRNPEWFITCFDFSDGTAPAPGPSPVPPASRKCCYSKWGPLDGCGKYPSAGHGGLCNMDWVTKCEGDGDCKGPPAPTPSPGPTPVPPSPTPPSPTPPSPTPPTPTPPTPVPPPAPTPAPPSPTPPAPTPTPPQPAKAKCCWSKWGDKDSCGNYPGGSSGAHCNTDWSKSCNSDTDCKSGVYV